MPRGDKSSYSGKQQRQAEHIEQSEQAGGRSKQDAERIAWATVNKQDEGAEGNGVGKRAKTTAKGSNEAAANRSGDPKVRKADKRSGDGTEKKPAKKTSNAGGRAAKNPTKPATRKTAKKTTTSKSVSASTRKAARPAARETPAKTANAKKPVTTPVSATKLPKKTSAARAS